MKIIFLLVSVAFFQSADAQDFCSLIKKEVSPGRTIYDYSSPFNPLEVPSIRVTRSYGTDPDFATDNFYLIFQVVGDLETIYLKTDTGQIEKEEFRLVVEFDDKSKMVDDTVKISHDFTADRTQAIRYAYYPVSEAAAKDFSTKKIAKFSLAGFAEPVIADSANAVMHYVQCMKALK